MQHTVTIPAPKGIGRDTAERRTARQRLAELIWDKNGKRRLVGERSLVKAIEQCDPRDVWWVCEMSSAGPVYQLPTREWITHLRHFITKNKVRTVLEVAAGDGFLAQCLAKACPKVRIIATDDKSWSKAHARMSAADRQTFKNVAVAGIQIASHFDVKKMAAVTAVKRYSPDLVIISWAPPGTLVERVIRAPSRLVLDISPDGDVCGNGTATWRFSKDFIEGPLERRALCRLDSRPTELRHSRMTLYYGRKHPMFEEEKP